MKLNEHNDTKSSFLCCQGVVVDERDGEIKKFQILTIISHNKIEGIVTHHPIHYFFRIDSVKWLGEVT